MEESASSSSANNKMTNSPRDWGDRGNVSLIYNNVQRIQDRVLSNTQFNLNPFCSGIIWDNHAGSIRISKGEEGLRKSD